MDLEDLKKQADELAKENPKEMTLEMLESLIDRVSKIIDKSEEKLNKIEENERNN